MLKLYDVKWHTRRNGPAQLTSLPGANVIWVVHATNGRARDAEEYHRRVSTGIVAAIDINDLLFTVYREFPGAMIVSIAEFDGLPYLTPDAPAPAWAIERYNYFANTGKLLPMTTLLTNGNGHGAITIAVAPTPPLHSCIECGIQFPYDDRSLPLTTERTAVLSVLANLSDRRGIKWELEGVDQDIREEMVDTLTEIVKSLLNR